MIVIEFRFPAGRWHATAWGTHVNEGIPEWPPSPWRLCRALWATWFHKHKAAVKETDVRELIETLIDGPLPRYQLPPAVAAHTRHYMPSIEGKNESKTKIFDTFVQISKTAGSDRLLVVWDIALASGHRELLQALLVSMSYFGRAESLVEAMLLPETTEAIAVNATPVYSEHPDHDQETVKLLAPLSQEEFFAWRKDILAAEGSDKGKSKKLNLPERVSDCLLVDTADWKKAQWNQPPGSRWITYRRPEHSFQIAPPRHKRQDNRIRPTVARFVVDSNVLPDITQALSLGERLHRALVKHSDSSPVFSGCNEAGQPLKGHRHAFYFSEPDGPRGEVRYLTIYALAGFDARERTALEGLRKVWDYDSRSLSLTLVSIGDPTQSDTKTLFGPARIWQSITPFVPTRHPKVSRNGKPKLDANGTQIGSPVHDLRRLLADTRPDLPAPEVEPIPGPDLPRRLVWLDYQRFRRHGQGNRANTHGHGFRLTFSKSVTGPIALGYAAHFGLGLFVPVPENDQP